MAQSFSSGSLILSIDGGATSTKALLSTLGGDDIAMVETEALNLRTSDHKNYLQIFRAITTEIIASSGHSAEYPSAIAVGVSGGGNPNDRRVFQDALEARWPGVNILLQHDAYTAQYGAFGGEAGVIVIAGTGSIAYGRNDRDEEARSGGWGWMLGDEGSGWWIGREAIRVALASEERGETSVLSQKLCELFEADTVHNALSVIYHHKFDRTGINELSITVNSMAEEGDSDARDILFRAGEQLAIQGVRVAQKLEIPLVDLQIALMGGVAKGAEEFIGAGVDNHLVNHGAPEEDPNSGEQLALEEAEEEISSDPRTEPLIEYPPKDLTIIYKKGPRRVQPQTDALHGAALWAKDKLLRSRFI